MLLMSAQIRKRRAAAYIRLSKWDGPADDTNSPLTQRHKIEAWCTANDCELAAVYEDLDVSGGSTDRPQLALLRQRWASYDVVVAASLDRVSRSVRDFATLATEAQQHHVTLATVREGLDLASPVGRFVATILAAFAEMELEMIRERTRAGKATAKALGRWSGGPAPYGFRSVAVPGAGAELQVDDAEAAAIREGLAMRSNGASWRAIGDAWWRLGFRPRRAPHWSSRSIGHALTSTRLRDAGVLSAAEHEEALRVCGPNMPRGHRTKPLRWSSGVLHCGSCGGLMYVANSHALQCGNSATGRHCDRPVAIRVDGVEAYLQDEYLDRFGNAAETRIVPVADANAERRAELQATIRALSESLPDLPDDELPGVLQRRAEAREALAALAAGAARGAYVVVNTGRTLGEAWVAADDTGKRAALLAALAGVEPVVPPVGRGRRIPAGERIEPRPLFGH